MSAPDYRFELRPVGITDIMAGDVVDHNGAHRTVCRHDIKYDWFVGTTLFGDSYQCGHKPVMKVIILTEETSNG